MLQLSRFRFITARLTTSSASRFPIFGGAFAIGLAALLLLTPLGSSVSAQKTSGSKTSHDHHFIIYKNGNAEMACRGATAIERSELERIDTSGRGLQQINHLQYDRYAHRTSKIQSGTNLGTNLTIILRATTQLQNNAAAQAAFVRAAQNWETLILSPITIYIDVDFGTTNFGTPWPANVLGSTGVPSGSYSHQSVRTNLIAEAVGEGNATKQAIFNSLPSTTVPTDIGDALTTDVPDSLARAIGLLPPTAQSTDPAASIAFNSAFTYDFDPTDGITAGQTDFDAVATHEIGHALGFDSDAGGGLARPSVWDLYRFRTGTTSDVFATAQRIMTIGGSPDPLQFDFIPANSELGLSNGGLTTGVTTNGADGWQSSHWKHSTSCSPYIGIMDPAISSGCRRTITSSDVLAVTSFGYNLSNSNPPPPPPAPTPTPSPAANDNFANATLISGCFGSVTGTNFGATKEAGEPNNPDSPTSTRSVWYQWQAPSTGTVTMDTIGSDFDTVLAVYTGSSVGALSLVAHNDDIVTGTIVASSLTFSATQGAVYRIAINGFNNDGTGGDIGNIRLNWTDSNCVATQEGTNRAIAIDAVTFVSQPLPLHSVYLSNASINTRVMLFTSNLGLSQPDPGLSVQASGFTLPVENVGTVRGLAQASYIVVTLPDNLPTGDLTLTVTLNGKVSNSAVLGISP